MQSGYIHSSGAAVNNVRDGRNKPHKKDKHTSKEKSCFRCKSTRHVASSEECPARTKTCRSCGKKGHFAGAKFCRGAKGQINSMDNSAKKYTADTGNDIEALFTVSDNTGGEMFNINAARSAKLSVQVNNTNLFVLIELLAIY
ncbi:hypothetical protein EB796_018333 [Bugula neritina]|uniref:Uncharacterized protein n=1 Tax=Bugula neritina TaxID=10212 RepID=A0A7J7JCM6_BUGNE|nr:hypothetical protein EB796_018333 [Bugula neritina]